MTTIGNEPFSLFISDLHLCASRPHITAQFLHFLSITARHAENLYILGDLFEYWAGDDDLDHPDHQTIIAGLHALSQTGTRIFYMHGNRDFLLGEAFAKATGITLLRDPSMVDLYGKTALLSHGDALCTDDVAYQEFRQQVRDPAWLDRFLAQPLQERKAQIEAIRRQSEQAKSQKSESIMDVNPDAVVACLRAYQHPHYFIHGHTHRPNRHTIVDQAHTTQRWVLGDWYEEGSCLMADASGLKALDLSTP